MPENRSEPQVKSPDGFTVRKIGATTIECDACGLSSFLLAKDKQRDANRWAKQHRPVCSEPQVKSELAAAVIEAARGVVAEWTVRGDGRCDVMRRERLIAALTEYEGQRTDA